MEAILKEAFKNSLIRALEAVGGTAPVSGTDIFDSSAVPDSCYVGTIGIENEDFTGSVSLIFLDETINSIHDNIYNRLKVAGKRRMEDIIGEIVNLTVGGARKDLEQAGIKFKMTPPRTGRGGLHYETEDISVLHNAFHYSDKLFIMEICTRKTERE
ncbi:chemotaxis protein CheX [bacterium]|nr:chemotaxis protein CheX [FCB group bacterium]MBL7191212.1 chemotaxis protein CheX [bacterium]